MLADPKLHHTVAQTYQKFFSPDGKTILRYDKKNRVLKRIGIKNAAALTHFYTIIDAHGDKNVIIETDYLAPLDSLYAPLVERIKNRADLEGEKPFLKELMVSSYSRVTKQRNRFERMFNDLYIQRKALGSPVSPIKPDKLVGAMLIKTDVYIQLIQNSDFVVAEAVGNKKFITCDNPADKALLPLTPDSCLMMLPEQKQQQYVQAPNEIVHEINKITFEKADRYVFAYTEDDLAPYLPHDINY